MTRPRLFAALVGLAIIGFAFDASAQSVAHIVAGGRVVPGGSREAGYEDWHDVELIRHEMTRPVAGGLPSGHPELAPIRLRLRMSNGVSTFFDALNRGQLVTVQIVSRDGDGVTNYTIDIADSRLSRVRTAWSERSGEAVIEIEISTTAFDLTSRDGTMARIELGRGGS